jgi:DNA-binding CsgD family transcriptional regulator/tetratricopeptide (TPR) repeat protein
VHDVAETHRRLLITWARGGGTRIHDVTVIGVRGIDLEVHARQFPPSVTRAHPSIRGVVLRQTDGVADVLCSVVVGRRDELHALSTALDRAEAARGGVVVLTGEAGIGKSRLTREAMAKAERNGMLLAVGRAIPAGDGTPFGPITEALLHVLRHGGLPDDAALAPWLPVLTAIVPAMGGVAQADAVPAARGEAVLRLLRGVGAEAGVVVVLEDLHWADPDTLGIVEYLAGNLRRERILCVITVRSETPSAGLELVRRLRGRDGVVHLPLTRLDDDEVAEMVRACAPGAGDGVFSRVQDSAEGIPLLVEELLASPGVPRSFTDTVEARLIEFSPQERSVLEAAALLGRRFDWHLLPAATGLAPELVTQSLERAVRCLLITVEGDTFRFRHALTRDAVVDAMLPPRRSRLAAQVLEVLEPAGTEPADGYLELAADLAVRAGDGARAGALLVASGRASLARGALATAVETLRRSTAVSGGRGGIVTAAERMLLEALSLAGRVDEAISVGAELIGQLESDGATVEAAEVHLQLAHAAVSATRWNVAASHLAAAKAMLASEERSDLVARLLVVEAEVALAGDDVERSRQLASAALAARDAGAEVRCQALEILGRCERLADLSSARRRFEQALAIAETEGLPFWRLRALHELGTIEMFERGGIDRLEEARRSATELGALSTLAVLDLQLAVTRNAEFSLDASAEHARQALELAERLGLDQVKGKALFFLAENGSHRRERDEMERYLGLALAASPHDPSGEAWAWGARGTLSFLEGDWEGALQSLARAAEIFAGLPHAEPAQFRALWPLLLASVADPRAEAALIEASGAGIDRAFANAGVLGYAEAVLLGRREPVRATERARESDAILAVFSGPWPHFARLCASGPALENHWGEPDRWLQAAEACFAALGFDRLEERCRVLRHPPVRDPWLLFGVTARESDVLRLVAEGLNNKEIAVRLHLSPRTVEKHLESLMRKTGTRSRTQLAVTAALRVEDGGESGGTGRAGRTL